MFTVYWLTVMFPTSPVSGPFCTVFPKGGIATDCMRHLVPRPLTPEWGLIRHSGRGSVLLQVLAVDPVILAEGGTQGGLCTCSQGCIAAGTAVGSGLLQGCLLLWCILRDGKLSGFLLWSGSSHCLSV